MEKIKSIFVLIMFILFASFVAAQSVESIEDEILTSLSNSGNTIIGDSSPESGNTAIVNQFGDDNSGLINQFQSQYGVGGNYGNIYQDGSFNDAILYQYGNQISTNISQVGSNNYANVVLSGTDINGNILQDGFGNYLDQNLSGSDFDYSVLQDGNNNLLIHYQEGIYSTNFEISQVGDGITTVITDGAAIIK